MCNISISRGAHRLRVFSCAVQRVILFTLTLLFLLVVMWCVVLLLVIVDKKKKKRRKDERKKEEDTFTLTLNII